MLAQALDKEPVQGQAFNFGSNEPYTVIGLVNAIMARMNRQNLAPQILNQAAAEIKDQTLCSRKAENLLGWKPLYTLEEGLSETVKWYESYFAGRCLEVENAR